MSLEAARGLTIPELLRVLNEKLGLECTRLRELPSPPDFSTASLEAEIRSLETKTRDVLGLIPSLKNLLQPVNRLPPEILSFIAQCFHDESWDVKPIIPLTHVCRYWRESITSVPANWVVISNFTEGLMALSLERAKAAPLQVALDIKEDPESFYPLAPYVQNIDTLRVFSSTTIEKLRQAIPNFPQSTPNLRSISAGLIPDNEVDWDRSVDPLESLTSTLTCFELYHVPLYPSLLRLRSLTELIYWNKEFDLHLDTLLDFLEWNHSLKSVCLGVMFREASLRRSQRKAAIENRFRYLKIWYWKVVDIQALISGIPLRKGAQLDISHIVGDGGLTDILSGVSTTHLLNLRSPTAMRYGSSGNIQLLGPNGGFSFQGPSFLGEGIPFAAFPLLPLTHVREFCLIHRTLEMRQRPVIPLVFDQSFFPALEMVAVDCDTNVSHLLSALFSNPSSPPLLETIAFMNCDLTQDFVEELTQYASKREGTTSTSLHKVVIVNSDVFPSIASIRKLEEHVSVVDVRVGKELPKNLI